MVARVRVRVRVRVWVRVRVGVRVMVWVRARGIIALSWRRAGGGALSSAALVKWPRVGMHASISAQNSDMSLGSGEVMSLAGSCARV